MTRTTIPILMAALLGTSSVAPAQTLYSMDSGVPGPAPIVYETTGPPAACGYPNGPLVSSFPTDGPGTGCAYPTFAPPLGLYPGDVAVDRSSDTVWAGDSVRIAEYRADGTRLQGFPLPNVLLPLALLSGLAVDSSLGAPRMAAWNYVAELLPLPGCSAGSPALWTHPGTLGQITDVSHDPSTDTLWICNAAGEIANVDSGTGAVLAGPITVTGCGLTPPLLGIAVDTSTPNFARPDVVLYVTDGSTIAYIDSVSGFPAPTTFYTTSSCQAAPASVNGLAFAAHGITYGSPSGSATISMTGQSVQGGAFAVELAGGTPGADLYLLLDTNVTGLGALCPAPALGSPASVYVDPSTLGPIPLGNLGAGSSFTLPLSLGPLDPPGITFFMQFVLDLTPGVPGGPYETTEGLAWTIARP